MKYYVSKGPREYEIRASYANHTEVIATGTRELMNLWAWAANAVADNMCLQAWPNDPSAPGAREYEGSTEGLR